MKVLIVEDSEDLRKTVRGTLKALTRDIHEAGDAVETLRFARAELPDIVILGMLKSNADGYELCYRIKVAPELKHTRVIMLSARPRDVDISIGLRGFADAYLEKPFDPVLLLATVGKLRGGASGTPAGD
ncbi:MAG: response regulator [Betaproteobacteria bacterium]|nr:response regulator [Betaproteobacteria bacterium]